MCGILGFLQFEIDDQQAKKCLKAISHRGPDSSSFWGSPDGEVPVWLGHTRLSILDLSHDGDQPMHSVCGRYVIVFNGEIYNFLELREELECKGYQFRTQTDTEVLLVGLIDEGTDFQLRCNGMWAFCLWDRQAKTALFGRDRFGKKPLFYAHIGQFGIAFASEMKALYPILPSIQPNERIEDNFLNLFNYEYTKNCVIVGINRIPPGYWAFWKDGNLQTQRWWNTLDHLEAPPSRYEEQVERWRELFLDAVRLRMRADVQIGTALSGGLDSSSTFCSMAHLANQGESRRQSNSWQHGFCSSYPGSDLDEVVWAQIVSNHIGIPLQVVEIDPLQAGWTIQDALYQVEDPYLTLPLPMLATYKAISQAGIKVTLDGHGADELFSGYGGLSTVLKNTATPLQMVEILAIERSMYSNKYEPDFKYSSKVRQKFSESILNLRKTIASLRKRLPIPFSFDDQNHPAFQEMDPLNQSLYEMFHVTVLPTLLRNYDRYSMTSGIEIRMPFMDWRLVCFTFSLPWTSKVGGTFTKRIVRDAMKGILPEPIRTRRSKVGWNAPLHEWFKDPLKEEVSDLVYSQALGLPHNAIALWENFQTKLEPRYLDGERLWCQLMPAFWYKSLGIKATNVRWNKMDW